MFLDFRKVGKFAASIERLKAKSVSASGGLCPQTPVCACHGLPPHFQIAFVVSASMLQLTDGLLTDQSTKRSTNRPLICVVKMLVFCIISVRLMRRF